MSEDVSVYMRWYVKDYLAKTMNLNAEQRGAYSTLLAQMWANHGWLTLDHRKLAFGCGVEWKRWAAVWDAIKDFFLVNDEVKTFTNKRIQEELEAAREGRSKRAAAGSKGAKKRWQSDSNATAAPSHGHGNGDGNAIEVPLANGCDSMARHPSSVIRQDQIPLKSPEGDGEGSDDSGGVETYSTAFLEFWQLYPRKVGKGAAWRAWKRLRPTLADVGRALMWQIASADWTKDGGAFIPHPATYLNARRWEDERPAEGSRSGADSTVQTRIRELAAAEGARYR